jgi:hypothetical protein
VFWYLESVEEGGETFFPRALNAEGKEYKPWNGDHEDCYRGLAVKPVRGNAVLFYSMVPDGRLDERHATPSAHLSSHHHERHALAASSPHLSSHHRDATPCPSAATAPCLPWCLSDTSATFPMPLVVRSLHGGCKPRGDGAEKWGANQWIWNHPQRSSFFSTVPQRKGVQPGAQRKAAQAAGCTDDSENCAYWAESGECEKNRDYMQQACRASCKAC